MCLFSDVSIFHDTFCILKFPNLIMFTLMSDSRLRFLTLFPETLCQGQCHSGSSKSLHLNHLMEQFQTLYLDRSHAVGILGNISCNLDPCVKVKGQITYFLVNASPTKPLDVATLNFVPE